MTHQTTEGLDIPRAASGPETPSAWNENPRLGGFVLDYSVERQQPPVWRTAAKVCFGVLANTLAFRRYTGGQ